MPPVLADVPVQPTPPEATQWLLDELADPVYRAAQPTILDRIGKAIADWLGSLFGAGTAAPDGILLAVVLAAVAVGIAVLLLVFGVPRRIRRSAGGGAVLGVDDRRSADRMRRDAAAAARRGDWVTAIADRFRALARAIADREVVTVLPGTTAHEVAIAAGIPFPDETEALSAAAAAFDEVRYLSKPGDEARYVAVVALDERIAASRPAATSVAGSTG